MAQCESGWRALLSLPQVYGFCQNLLGGSSSRRQFIENHIRPKPGMRILDLGCGPAAILAGLPPDTHYVGVDLSKNYIDAAIASYGSRGEFHCLSVDSLPEAGLTGFDLVLGLGVLHHLDDNQARNFFALAAKALNNQGRCLTIDPCLVRGQHPFARMLIRLDRGRNVRTPEKYAALARPYFAVINPATRHDLLRVPYSHQIMDCRQKDRGAL